MINLLPPEVKESFKFAKYNVILVKYVLVAVVAIAVMSSLMFYGNASLSSQADIAETALANDRAEISELEKINTEAQELSNTIDTIGTILDREVRFSLLLQEIGSIMPNGVILSAISLSQDTTDPIRMSVALTSAERAGVLQQNLAESRLFVGADIVNVSKATGQESGYDFAGDIIAYYDPAFSLATLDDPIESESVQEQETSETDEALNPETTTQQSSQDTSSPSQVEDTTNGETAL